MTLQSGSAGADNCEREAGSRLSTIRPAFSFAFFMAFFILTRVRWFERANACRMVFEYVHKQSHVLVVAQRPSWRILLPSRSASVAWPIVGPSRCRQSRRSTIAPNRGQE